MIKMTDWRVHVPPGDGMLGYETETGVSRLAIQLDGTYEGWAFKLDTRREYSDLNVFDFVHEGNVIYFEITDELGLAAGRYVCQVRGECGDKRKLSASFSLYVAEAVGAIEVLENVPVAEMYQLEQRLTALKTQCEQLAQAASGQSESAVQAAASALESAAQALESAREADASRQTAVQAAEAAARDAGTSEAAAARAQTARADALTASTAAAEAADAAQAALTSAQAAALAAQNAASAAATDRQAAERAADTATSAARTAETESARAAEYARAAEESARAAAASAEAAAESERQAKASEEAAAESAAASKLDAQATAADREAVAADKNAAAADRQAAEAAAASAKTDADRIAALDTYSKREADELFAGKADQPYASAAGAFINIQDSAGGMLGGLVIRGNSVQDGTPSPDAPAEIQSVQSPVALTVCGANLINDTPNAAVTNKGLTFSAADGGGTRIIGTSTGTYAQNAPAQYGSIQLPAGTWTIFVTIAGDTGGATICAKITDNGISNSSFPSKPIQVAASGGTVTMCLYVQQSGVTLDCVVRVMLVPRESAARYEPYAGQAYSIPLVAADTEAFPDPLELCRVGDVCDTIERRDGGVWGVNKVTVAMTFDGSEKWNTKIGPRDTVYFTTPISRVIAPPNNLTRAEILSDKYTTSCANDVNLGVDHTISILNTGSAMYVCDLSYSDADALRAHLAAQPLNVLMLRASPLWIPLSDEAQAVLDSIRLPAGIANVFATNSPAPELELTYRKTVISLPTPTKADAGKAPVVSADGDGYELTAMAAGGAAETWVKIGEYTWTAEDAAATSVPRIIFTEDANGSPISCDKILISGWAYTESNRILYGLFGENLQIVNANYLLDAGDILRNDKGFIAQVSLFEDPVPHAESQFAVLPYINGGNSAGSKLWTPSTESRFEYPIKKITLFPNAQILEGSTFEVWGRSVNV